MLAKILYQQMQELSTQAAQEDAAHILFVQEYPRTPKAFCPPTGCATRQLRDQVKSALDVAETLERSWGNGDRRAGAELATYAEQLCAFEVATAIRRQLTWQDTQPNAPRGPRKAQAARQFQVLHLAEPYGDKPQPLSMPKLYTKPNAWQAPSAAKLAEAAQAMNTAWGN